MNKETIEEAAESYAGKWNDLENQFKLSSCFIAGANYQAEKMYSEEEVLQLLLRLQQTESYDNLYEWFEQFKK